MKPVLNRRNNNELNRKYIKIFFFIVLAAFFCFFFLFYFYSETDKINSALALSEKLERPTSTQESGLYNSPILLKLEDNNNTTQIFYTLDGSEPSVNSIEYKKPFKIECNNNTNHLSNIPTSPRWKPPIGDVFKGTILRAICVDKINNIKSKELIKSFFINAEEKNEYSIPVVSIVINKEDFFSYKKGIYVLGKNYEDKSDYIKKKYSLDMPWWSYPANYLSKGKNAGRKIWIEYINTNNTVSFSTYAEAKINGNATRGFAQKSLRISLDSKMGKEHVDGIKIDTIFKNKIYSFVLRNSGNDWDKTLFRDEFMQSLMVKTNLSTQSSIPVLVFINGEYWGIHHLKEKIDEFYFSEKYGLNIDSLTILENMGTLVYGSKQDSKEFEKLLDFCKNKDLSLKINYDYLSKKIDIENFMDMIIANVYFCNSDWPNNNVKYWRNNNKVVCADSIRAGDGRWRWILFDTDWGFGYTSSNAYELDLLDKAKHVGSVGVIFSSLLKNQDFLTKFKIRFNYHLLNTFDNEKVEHLINDFQKKYSPEIQEHINRWRIIGSVKNWDKNVEDLKIFSKKRMEIQKKQLDFFLKNQ